MKKIVKQLFFLALLAALFASCKKDENKVYFDGGTPPVLTASATSADLPLSFVNRDNEALKLSWTNPNYKFNTGISSQDVSYQIEIDTAGANFTNPKKQTVSVSKELNHTFIVSEFNGFLLNQLALDTSVVHNIEIRVKSSLINSSAVLYSNVLKYTVVPYAIPPAVAPPASRKLYITGNATAGNWMAGGDPELANQKFTQISPTLYEITVALIGGGSYTFVPVYGDWTTKYSIKVKNDPAEVNGGDFQVGGEDILAPAASGNYKIEVDFQRGKFTVTKL
jgi:starch-binding outer membrane protein SusE/F